jgi:hypothetical protein
MDRRKFSGFSGLRQLSITGIDELGCTSEIALCMTASSSTLKSLTLSFSSELSRKARKPSAPPPPPGAAADIIDELDDDDDDDDYMTQPDEHPITVQAPLVNEADIRKEKALQETVLAKVFGLETSASEEKRVEKALSTARPEPKNPADQAFYTDMTGFLGKLSTIRGSPEQDHQEFLKIIKRSVERWIEAKLKKNAKKPPVVIKPQSKPKVDPAAVQLALSSPQLFHPSALKEQFIDVFGTDSPSLEEVQDYMNCFLLPSKSTFPPSNSYHAPGQPSSYQGSSGPSAPIDNLLNMAPQSGPGNPVFSDNSVFYSLSNSQNPAHHNNASGGFWGPKTPTNQHPGHHPDKTQMAVLQAFEERDMATDDDSGDSAEETDAKESGGEAQDSAVTIFKAVVPPAGEREEDMDVDMEHPDVVESDADDEQGVVDQANGVVAPETPTLNGVEGDDGMDTSATDKKHTLLEPGSSAVQRKTPKPEVKKFTSGEEELQRYIRSKHGFHLEELSLHLVPLKASVIARALELSCLTKLTLLGVGQQVGLWTLVDKVRKDGVAIHLRSIHTDDVSFAFLDCVTGLSGLTDLFLMKRHSKDANSSSSNRPLPSMTDIRLHGLRQHIGTLKRFMIWNHEDDSWDLDAKTLRLIVARGSLLKELAFNVSLSDYVSFPFYPLFSMMANLPSMFSFRGCLA